MFEAKLEGAETQSSQQMMRRMIAFSIERVGYCGMAACRQMGTDQVRKPGFGVRFHEGITPEALQHAQECVRRFASLGSMIDRCRCLL